MGLFSIDGTVVQMKKGLAEALGAVPIPELVRRVHQGDSSQWHEAVNKANALVDGHDDTGDRGSRMLQALESSWTGDGADAAAGRIRGGVKAAQLSSEVYGANARHYADNAYAFESLKTQLTPMDDQPPERSVWDTITLWDTDQEDRINRYRAQLEQNRQTYQAYEEAMKSSQTGVRQDFGDIAPLDSDIEIKPDAGKDSAGSTTFDESRAYQPTGAVPGTSAGQVGTGGSRSTPTVPSTPGWQPGDSTSPSGYPSPNVTAPAASVPNYQTPGSNPLTGFGPGSGGNNSSYGFGPGNTALGFGPTSGGSTGTGGRFSAPGTGGGAGSPGSGNAGSRLGGGGSSGAAGGLGSGKGSGVGPLGPAGQSAGSAGARGGMGAMGGAGAGRGQGSENEEHKRQYVQDSDEAFKLTEEDEILRDPETGNVVTPPTIGG